MRKKPCLGCTKRHYVCQDHCTEPEYLEYRAELETIRKNKQNYDRLTPYVAGEVRKNRRAR